MKYVFFFTFFPLIWWFRLNKRSMKILEKINVNCIIVFSLEICVQKHQVQDENRMISQFLISLIMPIIERTRCILIRDSIAVLIECVINRYSITKIRLSTDFIWPIHRGLYTARCIFCSNSVRWARHVIELFAKWGWAAYKSCYLIRFGQISMEGLTFNYWCRRIMLQRGTNWKFILHFPN